MFLFTSYPGCCVFKANPTSYPSREADSVTAAFIADIHARVPTICGSPVWYSSKALTPLAVLQPAVGCTGESAGQANLKPIELIPELDLSQFPIPPSMSLSQPATLPTETASLGGLTQSTGNSNHTSSTQSCTPQLSRPLSSTLNQTSRSDAVNASSLPQSSLIQHQPASLPLNVPSVSVSGGSGGRGDAKSRFAHAVPRFPSPSNVVVSAANSTLPEKVVPQFGRKGTQPTETGTGTTTPLNQTVAGRGRHSLGNITNSQSPSKRPRLNTPLSLAPYQSDTVVRMEPNRTNTSAGVHIPTATSSGAHVQQIQGSSQLAKSTTERSKPSAQTKGPIQVDGVSDVMIKMVRFIISVWSSGSKPFVFGYCAIPFLNVHMQCYRCNQGVAPDVSHLIKSMPKPLH